MSDDGWRARIRWVVVHPDREAVLVAPRDGAVRLPEAEQPGQVWTADPAEVLPGLRDLLGADAVLLRCLEEDEDPVAPGRYPPSPTAWSGRDRPSWPPLATGTPPWPPEWPGSWRPGAPATSGSRPIRPGPCS